jgi:nucleotide-binding universal stress UspA family protein
MTVSAQISLQNILVAVDFSPCSEIVLPYARSLARTSDATLFLAHVIPSDVLGLDPLMADEARRSAARQMEDIESADEFRDLPHHMLLGEGDIADVLSHMITEHKIDLILLGTHGRTGIRKLVMGSVAEKIFRQASCPVMTLGPEVCVEARHSFKLQHILCASDLQYDHPGSVAFASALAKEYQARLTVLHVIEKLEDEAAADPERVKKVLRDKLLATVEDPSVRAEAEPLVHVGLPAEEILKVAATRAVDLIVLGVHRPGGLSTHLMDVAYKVLCESPCPVLTVSRSYRRAIAA